MPKFTAVGYMDGESHMVLMVYTQHLCAACGSEHIRRNGSSQGHAKYQCKAYGHQARFVPAAVERAARYAQVENSWSSAIRNAASSGRRVSRA